MERIDVILVVAPSAHPDREIMNRSKKLSCPNLGLAYIAAVLKENGYQVAVVDLLMAGTNIATLKALLQQHKSPVVGITATTEAYQNSLRIARICKQVAPETVMVVGGPHVTFTADETLEDTAVDIVVRDEGEYAMLEIAGYYLRGYGSPEHIQGISYRNKDGKKIHNRVRPFLNALNELPFPARELFTEEMYRYYNGILTARGCLGRCFFCAAGALSKGKHRCRSVGSVVDELLFLQKNGIQFITFLDDNLTIDSTRVEQLCELMMRVNFHLGWAIESRIDTISHHAFQKLKAAGCKSIQFGIESGVQAILDNIQKGISLAQIKEVLSWAKEMGIQAVCSIMLGHPEDTWETAQETLRFSRLIQEDYGAVVVFAVATPFPGTPLFQHAKKFGLDIHSKNFDDYTFYTPICSTRHLTVSQLQTLFFESYMISKITRSKANEIPAS